LSDLEQKINFLDTRMDHLENSVSQLGQALVEGPGIDPDDPF
jgi:predicted aldo/keto reductase-like oxidoreductase